ncbi:PIR protein [Plasmodium vivax]|uniref:VIR protein n=1 Tax=Plasmodium vivax TaxID=5855 RepID=A0A564ZPK3_PLAVI|nr:PIR protein [Plasmodium vivax]
MEEFLGKSKLNNLNTIINYNSFSKNTNNCTSYHRIIAAKSQIDDFPWNNKVSDEILNALCYVYIKKETNTLDKNLCNYLYYWLGSKVFTNLRLKDFFYEVVKTIYDILSQGELGKVCNPVNDSIYDYNFQKFKDIYDLSVNYYTYKSHFIKFKPLCDNDYQNNLKTYKLLYNKLRNECSMEKTYNNIQYCDVFNKYFTEEKNAHISSWTCQLTETEEEDQLLEEDNWEDAAKIEIPESHVVGEMQAQRDWVKTAQHSRSTVPYLYKDDFEPENISSVSEDSSSSTIKKSVTSAVSAAGVLVPPFLIYNYAPARTWINKLLGMNKGTNRNPYANQELIAGFHQPEDFYSERNRYNIMYNPE